MLSVKKYDQTYIDACRKRVDAQVSAYRHLLSTARANGANGAASFDAAITSFDHAFYNTLVLTLDYSFVHRTRMLELKDGNPLNEVRVLCNSLLSDGVFTADNAIQLDPAKSVLGYRPGDEIKLNDADFVLLAEAFFGEIEAKFG